MKNRLFVATRKGAFVLERRAANQWKVAHANFLGDNLTIIAPDARDGSVYVTAAHGHFGVKLHRSDDGGKTFTEITAPQYPPQPEGQVDLCPMRKTPIPWKTELAWSLVPGGRDEPGVLWCGTIPGGLFRSADRGTTWELVRSLWDEPKRKAWFGGGMDLPGIHSICVDPRDSKRVTVGVSCGGAWYTADGGKKWECRADGMWAAYMPPEQKGTPEIQDPHCLVQCPVQPDHLWVQHHNGVFRSTDGAKSWHEVTTIQPSTFGFAVAVHPKDPNTAWFVPAIKDEQRIPVDGKVVVTRTRDGGKTCEVLRNGLPQENSYDLTFRHGLDVDDTGNVLAFGSTTGSLWVTEDGGDHWHGVTHHFPPIHCVRFG